MSHIRLVSCWIGTVAVATVLLLIVWHNPYVTWIQLLLAFWLLRLIIKLTEHYRPIRPGRIKVTIRPMTVDEMRKDKS